MQTSAKMIADSVSPDGVRLCTIECVLWRPLLAELNTHRDFSRNGASSRARSVKKTLQEVMDNPAGPSEFRVERRGMSGGRLLEGDDLVEAQSTWANATKKALEYAQELVDLGVHKSIVNRLIEPFMWHTHVITATEWNNFLEQRLALDEEGIPVADPDMYKLALAIKQAMDGSTPKPLDYGEWHLPYITEDDIERVKRETTPFSYTRLAQISTARCAGVSYLTQGVEGRDHTKDLALYERLRNAEPPHWSPFEHPATPWGGTSRQFNLTGWTSLRWFEQETRYVTR